MNDIKGYKVYNEKREFKRQIPVKNELSLEDNEWLKGVSCFVLNKEGKVLVEKRVNKGLTPRKVRFMFRSCRWKRNIYASNDKRTK